MSVSPCGGMTSGSGMSDPRVGRPSSHSVVARAASGLRVVRLAAPVCGGAVGNVAGKPPSRVRRWHRHPSGMPAAPARAPEH